MFTKARIKLTSWYLLIIMTISISFSAFIYAIVGSELQRRLAAIESRLSFQVRGVIPIHPQGELYILIDDLKEAKERIFLILLNTNLAIFIVSAVGGYFLAGKTLSPIEEALEEQKRFVSDAGHELKTPLTSMQTALEVALRDKNLSLKQAKKELNENLDDIKKLSSLTNNLLLLSRMQNTNSLFKKTKTDISKIIIAVIRKMKPLADSKKINISYKEKSFFTHVEPESFESLMTILIDNAIKYSHNSSKVGVELTKKAEVDEIKVVDSGVGIQNKDIPHVFERFYRVDRSRTKVNSDGYGLGLSIAKNIVSNHKGSICVRSKAGKGSTFVVRLPKN